MFYCPLHNWYSSEEPCKACHPMVTSTLSNYTNTDEQSEPESKDVFTWDDEKVKEFVITYNKIDKLIEGSDPIGQTIKEWKQSKQPLKPDVFTWDEEMAKEYGKFCVEKRSWLQWEDFKQARQSSNDDIGIDRNGYETKKLYTQQQLDEAIQKAFEAARKTWPSSPGLLFETVKSYFETLNYLNPNIKTSKHWP